MSYQGWENYETWTLALHINNNPEDQKAVFAKAREFIGGATPTDVLTADESCLYDFEVFLKSEYDDSLELLLETHGLAPSVWGDLLTGALSNVDWRELAQNFIDAAKRG